MSSIMLIATMSSKGQLTIPRVIRQAHGWHAGVKFSIVDAGNQLVLKPILQEALLEVDDVGGCIKYKGPKVSIEDMARAPYIMARAAKTK